jgi:FeS assembly SUF system protein
MGIEFDYDGWATGRKQEEDVMAVTNEQILAALRECYDPEIPINIYDLGLIYGVEADDAGSVRIRMTLTTPNCPSAQEMPVQVRARVAAISGVHDTQVELVWEPAWDPSRISPEGRKALGIEP